MVYAYDLWLPMPTKDLFDTLMMLASVNAAKDMYEKGLEEMKEFNTQYGEFLSPIDADMQWTDEHVLKPTRDAINEMYAAGVDPLRSKEGRALLARLRNNIDLGRVARNKQSAENAKQYLKNRDALIQAHLYDPEYEAWRLNGNTIDQFDSSNGVWGETSPMPLRDIDSIVEPWVKNLKPSFDEAYTRAKNDGYDYSTVSKDRILAVIDDMLPEFSKTSEGGYYRYLAERAAGGDNGAGDALLKEWMYNRASDHTMVERELNPERKLAIAHSYNMMEKSYSGSGNGGGRGESGAPSVFREADFNLLSSMPNASVINGRGGDVGYDRFEDPHYLWIDPIGDGIRTEKAGDLGYVYRVPEISLNTIYVNNHRYGRNKLNITQAGVLTSIPTGDRYFVPVGRMHVERIDGVDHYFITGTLTTSDSQNENGQYTYVRNRNNSGQALFDMEVTERAFNYAKKQSGVNAPSN